MAGKLEGIRERQKSNINFVGKPEGREHLEDRHKRENNIKVGHEEIGCRPCPAFIWFKRRDVNMEMEMEMAMDFLIPENTETSRLTGRPSAPPGLLWVM